MAQTANYTQQGLQVAYSPEQATTRGVKLPYGGPTGTGGAYAQGLILTNVGGTAQAEVMTITTTGSSGTFTFLFVADKLYSTGPLAYNCSTAVLQAALEEIFGAGEVVVTGTPGSSYVITFQSNNRIGGYPFFSNTFGSGSISIARTTRGSCGAGQYDVYDGSTYTTTDAILEYKTLLTPQGGLVGEYVTSTNQPIAPPAYQEGYFFVFGGVDGGQTDVANLPNIDAAAVGAGQKLRKAVGSSITEPGAVVRLVQ